MLIDSSKVIIMEDGEKIRENDVVSSIFLCALELIKFGKDQCSESYQNRTRCCASYQHDQYNK